MKVGLYLSVLCNKLVLSAWCAYIRVLPPISLYALKVGSPKLQDLHDFVSAFIFVKDGGREGEKEKDF